MPLQPSSSIQNSFIGGLKTEFTGLNFPKNAATDTENCVFDIVGDVTRRLGFDYEDNYQLNTINRTGKAISTYRWKNVSGNGSLEILVQQIGSNLYFYKTSEATPASPISKQLLTSPIDIGSYLVSGSSLDPSVVECGYSAGNGFLFVYHPYCEPFYCAYASDSDTITSTSITVQTRDFKGVSEGVSSIQTRPTVLTDLHKYNLLNQGWTAGGSWAYSPTTSSPAMDYNNPATGSYTYTVASGMSVVVGQAAAIYRYYGVRSQYGDWYYHYDQAASGIVTAYSGTSLTILVSSVYPAVGNTGFVLHRIDLTPVSTGYIDTWLSAIGNYPSNSDVWWRYKDDTGTFAPATTVNKVTANVGAAPSGRYILNEFTQQRALLSGVTSIPDVSTNLRPRIGSWFAGRVWYAGIDDTYVNASTSSDVPSTFYDWSENLYFSRIVESSDDFGLCYEVNDPTSEDLFDLLPDDGGVISIQGCGKIYKLFPIQNGMLVFCQNGIWFITGSKGIGFSANDYTVTPLSSIQSMSSTSFVDVMGLPYFWNEEGIYSVSPTQQGIGLQVNPITVDSILSWYNEVPSTSKAWVRGDYDPINYILTWVYRSTQETNITDRYEFNSCLNYNTYTKAFYPYTLEGSVKVNGINYVSYPNVITAPDPGFKYLCSVPASSSYNFTFAEEKDEDYVDFESSGTGTNYISYFITGYELTGQGQRRFQPGYVLMYSRADEDTKYKIQGIFDYAINPNSGQWSSSQLITNHKPNYGMIMRRHAVRGHGYVLQLKVTSVDGEPFDIMGWSTWMTQNTGV